MPRLTEQAIAALKSPDPGRYPYGKQHWDSVVRGFGVRVMPSGLRCYVVRCEWMEAGTRHQAKERFGAAPWGYGGLERRTLAPLAQARQHAREWIAAVKGGKPKPVFNGWLPDDGDSEEDEPAALPKEQRGNKPNRYAVEQVVEAYIHEWLQQKSLSHFRQAGALLRKDVAAPWMGRDIRGIKRQDVAARVREIALTRPIQANRALAIMGGMFSWAMDVAVLIETNPAARLKRVTQEHSRDRVLSDAEIGAVWFASGEVHRGFTGWIDGRWWNAEGYPWQQFFRLLLATGQRLREVGHMRWDELDLDAGIWTLPASRAKNKRPSIIPLSPLALEQFAECPRRGDFVFMSDAGEQINKPVNNFTKPKLRLDSRASIADVQPFTYHDLRRTVATGLQRLGVRQEVTEALLNHVSGSGRGIVGVYQRHDWAKEKREALNLWAKELEAIMAQHKPVLTEQEARQALRTASVKASPPPPGGAASLEEALANVAVVVAQQAAS